MIEDIQERPAGKVKFINGETYNVIDERSGGPFDRGYFGYGADFIIDFDNSPELQRLYYETTFAPWGQGEPIDSMEDFLITRVKDVVKATFPPRDYFEATRFAIDLSKKMGGRIPSLDEYVKAKIGFCAHTALTTAVLLERWKEKGYLSGSVSLDSFDLNFPEAVVDGHFWCKYRTPQGKTYVIDPSRDFVGSEEEYESIKKDIMFNIIKTVD